MRSTTLARVLNAAALAALYVTLLRRPGPFGAAYLGGLVIGAMVLGVAVLAAFGRRPLARFVTHPPFSQPRLRVFFAIAPWIALFAAIIATGSWWVRQDSAVRLFATYSAAMWSVVWCVADAGKPQLSQTTAAQEMARRLLLGMAAVFMVLGIDGLAFGLTPFGVATSALLALAASSVATTASFARPVVRGNLAAASVSVLLSLACVEAGLRLLRVGESVLEVDDAFYARQFHHMPPPGATYLNTPKALDEFAPVLIEINSLGIRGPEIPPGPVDMLLIGDSFVEARQLAWERTVGPQLAEAFRERSAPMRVVSHGVRGWSPLLEWNWYLKVGRKLKPRTVLLFFFWNDLWSSGDEARTFRAAMGTDGRPDHFDVTVEPAWVWYKHVRAMRLLEDVRERADLAAIKRSLVVGQSGFSVDEASAESAARRMAGDRLLTNGDLDDLLTRPLPDLKPSLQAVAQAEFWPGVRPMALWTEAQRHSAEVTEHELRLFADDVASDGGRLAIVYVPNAYQIAPTECSVGRYLVGLNGNQQLPPASGIQSWLEGVAERQHIELIDPSEAMRAYHRAGPSPVEPLHLRADCHWSARGHQFVAGFLADWYLRRTPAPR